VKTLSSFDTYKADATPIMKFAGLHATDKHDVTENTKLSRALLFRRDPFCQPDTVTPIDSIYSLPTILTYLSALIEPTKMLQTSKIIPLFRRHWLALNTLW
jgi:hypothetical protein